MVKALLPTLKLYFSFLNNCDFSRGRLLLSRAQLEGSDVSLPGLGTGITVEVHQLVRNFPEAQMLLRIKPS